VLQQHWRGYQSWARNRPTTAGLSRSHTVVILRALGAAEATTVTSSMNGADIQTAVAKVDAALQAQLAVVKGWPREWQKPVVVPGAQQYGSTPVWREATATLADQARSDAGRRSVERVRAAGLVAAGYAEARVVTWAVFNTKGLAAYATGTGAQFSQTVRDAAGTASGWAGNAHADWSKLDVEHLAAVSLEKCQRSLHAVAIEPGRYTTILEPQAVGMLLAHAVKAMSFWAEPYQSRGGRFGMKLGQRIMDARLTIRSDPADPDGPFLPFTGRGYPYTPTTWVDQGVLTALEYNQDTIRDFVEKARTPAAAEAARQYFAGKPAQLPNPTAFRVSVTGETTSIAEMIATTDRGLLVTRFDTVYQENLKSLLLSTVTRDGVWLVEKGKITHPVKNMRVLDSPLFYTNNVLQVGTPERIYGAVWGQGGFFGPIWDDFTPSALGNLPMVVPPLKVRDFNFVALADAV
jgi:predicted Zn-dependent protease